MTISHGALNLLDAIETIEMRSLEWGFTDGSLSERETELMAASTASGGGSGDDLIEELIDAKLLLEIPSSSGDIRIRSRFAEMMRLLAANRQLFPNRPWQGAPHLVADFRVDRRPRRFPKRNRVPADILAANAISLGTSPLRMAIWNALTSHPNMRLAAFQERAALRLSAPTDDAGTIITAGTGSGKTIGFYLPALLRIGDAITADHWVKAIAIYPRVELLKDQFAEAYRMARASDRALSDHGKRPIRIGALFRATPKRASRDELDQKKWLRRGSDYVCPWLRCPTCDGELVWREADLEACHERLSCSRQGCSGSVSEQHIVLTRGRLQQQPPDILFTTTEILNQRLSDHWTQGLFGIGVIASKKPLMALLDEVHTYEGASGAQAALTLRRWRHLLNAPISWVGLSATLGDAGRFFADLTGANIDRIIEVTPSLDELEEAGAEYQILLRGDPASRASLLSTSIQTSMLLARMLDPPLSSVSQGVFGRRAFLFTDDLDVTNRLFDDLRDAEAYTIFGKPDNGRDPLANLRAGGPDAAVRDLDGQRWRACEEIGHLLDQRLIVGRTTSQDVGVNQSANIIVATATLEVGYNDPMVGAVIQHKAPRSMASFLQRKGRAGRDRAMRPITVTILSDYGRDRAFYQSYEHLFDPSIEPQHLPIRNPYVLRIQAVYAMIEWLAARGGSYEKAWFWDILSRPLSTPSLAVRKVLEGTRARLTELVQGNAATISDLRGYLMSALSIDDTTADSLLWEAPRSLLLEAVPTLVRRLFRRWALAFPANAGDLDLQVDFHPLPDFVPRTLFSDLSLPEVRIIVPPATINHEQRVETLPILQALNQLVPGRVSRRFAFERGALSHWVAIDPAFPEQERRISDYAEEHEFVGTFRGTCGVDIDDESFLVFRPWTIRVETVAKTVALPSSNARLAWRTDLVSNGDPLTVSIPPRTQWRTYVRNVGFHLHRFRASVSVRRFAPTAYANVRTVQDDVPVTLHFRSDDDRPAAVGFELEVDGFYLDLDLPSVDDLSQISLPPALAASSRLSYLHDAFMTDPKLPEDMNSFQRDWLFQIVISALLADAAATGRPLDEVANDLLDDDHIDGTLQGVMDDLFGAIPPGIDDDEEADGEDEEDGATMGASPPAGGATSPRTHGPSRLQKILAFHASRPIVRDRLREFATLIESPDNEQFGRWLRRTIIETLGEALLQACAAAAPRHAAVDTLLVDIQEDCALGIARVWITEPTLGGAGVLQAFAEHFAAEPRIFFSALEAALAPTDLELVDGGLRAILQLSQNDSNIADMITRLRATNGHSERAALWQSFSRTLSSRGGIDVSHALGVSFNSRLLRAGSGAPLDTLLLDLYDHWDVLEARFCITIGLREFAYICSKDAVLSARIRTFLASTLQASAQNKITILSAVTNLLWPREAHLRRKTLHSYNPYRQGLTTDPALVRHILLTRSTPTIELSDTDWQGQLNSALEVHGLCRLAAHATNASALRAALVRLVAMPVDVSYLQFFPVVERVERIEGRILVSLALREQV